MDIYYCGRCGQQVAPSHTHQSDMIGTRVDESRLDSAAMLGAVLTSGAFAYDEILSFFPMPDAEYRECIEALNG